jgi:hypothetical protein
MNGAVFNPSIRAHLHHQSIQVNDRIDRIQRSRLPRLDLLDHGIRHVGDQSRRNLNLIHLFKMTLNLARRHAPSIKRQYLVIEPMPAGLVLRHQLRFEAGLTVPRYGDLHRPEIAL